MNLDQNLIDSQVTIKYDDYEPVEVPRKNSKIFIFKLMLIKEKIIRASLLR